MHGWMCIEGSGSMSDIVPPTMLLESLQELLECAQEMRQSEVCMYLCLCMHVCMYACMHVCMYVCMYVCIDVMYSRMYLCMYVCMYVCMYARMYACIYVYMIQFHSSTFRIGRHLRGIRKSSKKRDAVIERIIFGLGFHAAVILHDIESACV